MVHTGVTDDEPSSMINRQIMFCRRLKSLVDEARGIDSYMRHSVKYEPMYCYCGTNS